jgi:hypothetical protein
MRYSRCNHANTVQSWPFMLLLPPGNISKLIRDALLCQIGSLIALFHSSLIQGAFAGEFSVDLEYF